jgi:hypothetical protein
MKAIMELYNNCTKQQKKDMAEYCKLNFENEFPGFTDRQRKRERQLENKLRKQNIFGLVAI